MKERDIFGIILWGLLILAVYGMVVSENNSTITVIEVSLVYFSAIPIAISFGAYVVVYHKDEDVWYAIKDWKEFSKYSPILAFQFIPLFLVLFLTKRYQFYNNLVRIEFKSLRTNRNIIDKENIKNYNNNGDIIIHKRDAVKLLIKYPGVFYEVDS